MQAHPPRFMKIIDVAQGSSEWLEARAGIVTASELDNLISPTMKVRDGETPKTYMHTKIAERWIGALVQSFGGGVMEQGSILEGEALPWFAINQRAKVRKVGLVLTDDGSFGASPDGLVDGEYGVEIKCPQPPNHVKWLLAGTVPPAHLLQCYGGMYATGLAEWRFVSYCRDFPALVVRLKRDAMVMQLIAKTVGEFNESMSAEYKKLEEANGGPRIESTDESHPF